MDGATSEIPKTRALAVDRKDSPPGLIRSCPQLVPRASGLSLFPLDLTSRSTSRSKSQGQQSSFTRRRTVRGVIG